LLLRTDSPHSLSYAARFYTSPGSWRAWGLLGRALAGETPPEVARAEGRFAYLRKHPEEARTFDEYMAHTPDDAHRALAAACDFDGASVIVDVGGGNGEALRRILPRASNATGILLDREDVVAAIPVSQLLGGRIRRQAGDFFDEIPSGADVYLLIHVLHDWPDGDCLRILCACRRAMCAGARLVIGEHVLNPDPVVGEPTSYLIDVHMMAMFGNGRERSAAEFREMLAATGFTCRGIRPASRMLSVVEATAV
jgi:SAM-dependent methyltransferase